MPNRINKPPAHFIVLVPGYMGSTLRDRTTGKIVWVEPLALVKNPFDVEQAVDDLFDAMAYPNDDLEPAGIVNRVIFVPPLFKQETNLSAFKNIMLRSGYSTLSSAGFQPPPVHTAGDKSHIQCQLNSLSWKA